MLETLRFPLTAGGLLAIAIFALAGAALLALLHLVSGMSRAFDVFAAVLLLPVWFLVLGQLHCYGAFLMQAAARGHLAETPEPVKRVLNPFGSTAPIFALASIAVAVVCVELGGMIGWIIGVTLAAVLPASVTLMTFADSGIAGFHARGVRDVIANMGIAYAAFAVVFGLAYALLAAALLHATSLLLLVLAAAGYAFLVLLTLAGRMLFARRNELMLDTDRSPEQDAAAEIAAENDELEALLKELHRLCAVDRYKIAYERLDAYLARDRYRNDARVHEALQAFQGRDLRLEHACFYIERLLAARNPLAAWRVCKRCLDDDPSFRPLRDTSAITLVGEVDQRDAPYAETLLADFARAYPESAMHANAAFRRARLKIEHLGEREEGLALLREIEARHPRFAELASFRRYRDGA